MSTLSPGGRIGPYEIDAHIGAGGMGEVYRARDTRLHRTVAIKILPSSATHDATARERFEREGRAIAAVSHPNICVLHDVGIDHGVEFLVMEHLPGETLATKLAKGALAPQQVLRYAIQITSAVAAAHNAPRDGHRVGARRGLMPELSLAGRPALSYDLSPDGRQVALAEVDHRNAPMWIVPIDRGSPPARIPNVLGSRPMFGNGGEVFFDVVNKSGASSTIDAVRTDGTGLRRVMEREVIGLRGITADREWLIVRARGRRRHLHAGCAGQRRRAHVPRAFRRQRLSMEVVA